MKYIFYIIFGLLMFAMSENTFAQKKGNDKKKQTPTVVKGNGLTAKDTLDDGRIVYFRNINFLTYYYDKDKLDQINKYAEKGDIYKTYDLLYRYVMEFGIKNFYKDLYLVWRLGKLAEQLGFHQKAKKLYGIVLRHHAGGNNQERRLYYDSITRKDLDFYLPVEYYYTYANASSNVDTLEVPESTYTNIGDSVNTKYGEYGPTLTSNDLIMVFTSQRNRVNVGTQIKPNEDLFTSRKADSLYLSKTTEGTKIDTIPWTSAKPLVGLNSKYNEGSPCLSKDGMTIYFARCDSPDGYGNCDIYTARKQKNGTWTNIKNLKGINSIAWDSHPSLSHTEDTLFFASDRLGGFGMADIYFTYKVGFDVDIDGDTTWRWSPAYNIGPEVNSRYNEVSPFYHPKFNVLYFSSNGQLVNFGGFDIYKTKKHIGAWTEPKNIGPLVNYKRDEYYFAIDSKAQNLYYAKSIKVKVFDGIRGDTVETEVLNLHTSALPMEAQPEAVVKFEGVVTDSITGEAFEGIISIIDLDSGIEVAPKYLRSDGSYRFDLIRNNNYLVIITGEDFFRIEREFLLKGDTTMNISTPSIKFKKWKFEAIEFDESSSEVADKMIPDLEKLVFFLADHPNLGLRIGGHTDSKGDATTNLRLSQSRSNSIRNYLINKGKFKPERIEAIGYGSSKPIVQDEKTEEDKRINRRVEFEIFKLENK